jgi:glycosyltransferase involved in cell wall biosynthesis
MVDGRVTIPWSPDGSAPLVSVNVPCYRQLPHLRASLATILAQTMTEFEVNLFDDGCSDEYREYAQAIADPRLRYRANSARLGAMRNMFQAIFAGTGAYTLAFHEDDLLEPKYLDLATRILETHPDCGFVAAEVREFRQDSGLAISDTASDYPPYDLYRNGADFVRGVARGVEPMFGSVLYRRSAIEGIQPDHERYGTLVDRPFLLAILGRWSGAIIREPVAWYRAHSDDDRHTGMSSNNVLELLATYRRQLPDSMHVTDEALFFSYTASWLKNLYDLTPRSAKPSYPRFLLQAWRAGLYDPLSGRRLGLGRLRRVLGAASS